jgi:hypothetical protein
VTARPTILVIAIITLLVAACAPQAPAASPSDEPPPSVSPSQPAPTSAETAAASPEPTPVAAPEDWTQVHTIGDGSTRTVGAEIVWGGAGFLAVAREYEGAEGGPRITGNSMWRSPDGQTWTEVAYPAANEDPYHLAALSGAADGSYVFHTLQFTPGAVGAPLISLRSTDGETWEPLETGLPEDMFIQAIEKGPVGYLLIGGQGAEINPTLWLSDDALSWELVHEFSQDEKYVQIHDGDGGAEGYVVIGRRIEHDSSSYERFAFASADGREWFESAAPFGPDPQNFVGDVGISSHGGDWLATLTLEDASTALWSSADGLAWSEAGSLATPPRNMATPGLFEEVGDGLVLSPAATVAFDGTPGIWSSTDGTAWAPIDLGADAWVGELAIGDGVVAMTGTVPGQADGFTSTGAIWIRASD